MEKSRAAYEETLKNLPKLEDEREKILQEAEDFKKETDLDSDETDKTRDQFLNIFDRALGTIDSELTFIEKVQKTFATAGSIVLVLFALCLLIALGGIIFDLFMIVDCYNRKFQDRNLWLVILIGGGLFGIGLIVGLVYYFMVKSKPAKKK
jgi:hypothetical protein